MIRKSELTALFVSFFPCTGLLLFSLEIVHFVKNREGKRHLLDVRGVHYQEKFLSLDPNVK